MSEDAVKRPPDHTRRAAILATVGIVVILGLAVFYVAVVVPILRTNTALRDNASSFIIGSHEDASIENQPHIRAALERLGARDVARIRLASYLSLPDWLAPHRKQAVVLLSFCGPEAIPALAKCLRSSDWNLRMGGVIGLVRIKRTPPEAVPALRRMLATDIRYLSEPGWESIPPIVEALGNAGPAAREAIPQLQALTTDKLFTEDPQLI